MGALPSQELGDLEGCRPHTPCGQIRGMSGTAEEVGHRMVGGVAIGTGGLVGPAYGVTVGLKPRAMSRTELGEGAAVDYRMSPRAAPRVVPHYKYCYIFHNTTITSILFFAIIAF